MANTKIQNKLRDFWGWFRPKFLNSYFLFFLCIALFVYHKWDAIKYFLGDLFL
ncbi:MAG: hypothetical protein Ta2D_00090 [Rickettsiales bacterium]|nr:MAG: hypothetical protein Ta2D_00090 [Rickettsiales bacterium]